MIFAFRHFVILARVKMQKSFFSVFLVKLYFISMYKILIIKYLKNIFIFAF